MSAATAAPLSRTPTGSVLRLQNGKEVLLSTTDIKDDFDHIPIIDISAVYSDVFEERLALALALRDICCNIGFFYALNHGVPYDVAQGPFLAAKEFFKRPKEEKMQVFTGKLPDGQYQGYHPLLQYNLNGRPYNDLYEAFNFTYDMKYDPIHGGKESETPALNLWPENIPGFKERCFDYHAACLTLARKLIRIFALALDLPEDYFDESIEVPAAAMRMVHYPPQSVDSESQNGIAAHTDHECFTMVNQDQVGGLEVLNKSGVWVRAPYVPNTFVVNIADCLMRLSNDTFVSTVHRVVNNRSGVDRYSVPFFFGLNRNYLLEPLPTCVSEKRPGKYPIVTVDEYLKWRSALSKNSAKNVGS